jgi:gliding motility-associated-like protein
MKYLIASLICCLSIFSLSAQDINIQNGTFNQCSGTFFDSGGPAGDYANGENFVFTICPDAADLEIVLEFTAFLLNNDNGDFLSVYNSDTNDPAALIGTFAGTLANNPELDFLASTHPTGCLTFEFESNTFFNGPGWEADISCRPPCQTITPEILSIEPVCTTPASPNEEIPINTPVTFNAGATTSSGVTNDLTYEWFFNTNGPIAGQSVNQTFTNTGDVTVSLTVTDSNGCFETITTTVTVGNESIVIDENLFTLDQLIGEVLISGTCSVVDNIVSPNNASLNGIGYESYAYFNKSCSPFPFDEGLLMGTSNVNQAVGIGGGGGGWPGDPDLEALIQQPGNTNDATVIQFDFTPFVDQIQFNYIFSSYEYPNFVCTFADTFAFILSGPGISNVNDYDHDGNPNTPDVTLDLGGLNIALVPGTTTPVSPVNVHDETGCGAGTLGEFSFPQFYDTANSEANNPGDIDVTGRTRILTAQANVIPGSVYTIKLAIADRGDTILDSYVFLEGGSFELGANVGEDLVLNDLNPLCEGETQTLEVFEGLTPAGFTFQWTKDGTPIPGETGPTLDVTEAGEYCIELQAGTDCDSSDCIIVEYVPIFTSTEDVLVNLDLSVCDPFLINPVFDLTQNDTPILSNISSEFFTIFQDFQANNPGVNPYQVNYYENQTDAENRTNEITDPANYVPAAFPSTIFYAVEDTFGLGCFGVGSVGSFELTITEPLSGTPINLSACSDTPGVSTATFDLTENDALVLDGQDPATFIVSYFLNEQDAIDNLNPIANPTAFQNTSNPQPIWVRLEDTSGGPNCCSVEQFEIGVFVTPQPTLDPQILQQCGDFTLTQNFNLTANDAVSLGINNPGDVNVSYHTTQADADAGTNAIADPSNYIPSNTNETIFIRLENVNSAECSNVVSFDLNIFDVEIGTQPENLSICAQTANTGQTLFDLTVQDAIVFGANQDTTTHTLTYHNSEADAIGDINTIADPANYTSIDADDLIWVRVENNNDPSCFAITSFSLIVVEQPEVTVAPTSLSQCGDFSGTQTFDLSLNDAVAMGVPDVTGTVVSYHNSQEDADNNFNPIADPANYSPSSVSEPIFIRLENSGDSTCFVTTFFDLDIYNVEAIAPQDIEVCVQTGNTGETLFDLTTQNTVVFGPNQNPASHTISYHTSDVDATNNANPITNPDNYLSSAVQIWVRVQNNDEPTCFAITEFELFITEQPEVTIPAADLSQCGDFTGTQPFDLTTNNIASLGVPDAAGTNISYHVLPSDAAGNNNPIANPGAYLPTVNPQPIYIRLENASDPSCFIVEEFVISSFDVEAFQPPNLESCDDGTGNGTAAFNLNSIANDAFGPNQTITTHTLSFHESFGDADTGVNAIATPSAYVNISSPQQIWIRIENQLNPSCYAVTSFEIEVSNSDPINLNIDPLVACDDDNDGFFNLFDLTSLDTVINLGNPNIELSYHLTLADAENNVGALSSPYANVVENQQELFFRAVDITNGCEQFGSFFIEVIPSPLLTPIEEPLVACDDDFDGLLVFDLTQVEADALGSLDTTNLDITYHLSLAGAQNDTDVVPIPTAFTNTTSPQSIWIKVVDTSSPNLCFDIEEFEIIVESLPAIVDPEPLAVCDDLEGGDLSDEIASFNLNDKVDEITQGNSELEVLFFESEADLLADNPITPIDAYVNVTNPQTLEVLVTGSTNGCSIRTTLTLVVDPVPSMAAVLDPIEICDPDNDGFAEFDLEALIEDILNNEPEVSITFHLTAADAELGVNPIDTSVPFGTSNNDAQTIYVRAENTGPNGNDGTGCFDTRALDLIVVPSPEIANLIDLSICDDDSANGFASFDLTLNDAEALGGQDPTDIVITYHETQLDAEEGTNAIAVPTNYTNITNPQTIYVRLFNTVTGCVDLFDSLDDPNNTFSLSVETLPELFTPSILEVCDDDYSQDPFPQATFDLTVKETEIVGQTVVPSNLSFTYFESQDDLDNNNPIADPTNFVNTAQPQTIFIRVEDTSTQNACFSTVQLTINVLPLPSPSTTDPDVLRLTGCDDDNDGVAVNPFDLSFSGNFIAGSENVDITYYLNESGAINQDPDDLIANPTAYVNDPALNITDDNGQPTNVQIIYARVDNAVAGNFCFVIVPFELVVLPNPVLNPNGEPFAYTLCADDETNPTQATIFSTEDITNNLWDFTSGSSDSIIPLLDPNTNPSQNLADFQVSYHTSAQDAEDGVNGISPGYVGTDGEVLFVRVTNIESGCFNTNSIGQVQLVVDARPAIAQDNPADFAVCADDFAIGIATVDLTLYDDLINPGAPADTQVLYYEGQNNYDNGIAIADPANYMTLQTPQTIIAEVINTLTGCESSRVLSFNIIVNPVVGDISSFDGQAICVDGSGSATDTIVIDTFFPAANYSFTWFLDGLPFPATTPSIVVDTPGVYSVIVTNTLTGCASPETFAEIVPNIAPSFTATVSTPAFSVTNVILVDNIQGEGTVEVRLDGGPWIDVTGLTNYSFTNVGPGTHVVFIRDSSVCQGTPQEVMVIDYPPFFTPNNDGFNDTWNINDLADDIDATIYIFDRYGKLLKQLKPGDSGWDGTFNGKPMPSQDYWFRVEFTEPSTNAKSEFKAHFTLKR